MSGPHRRLDFGCGFLMGRAGFEPATLGLKVRTVELRVNYDQMERCCKSGACTLQRIDAEGSLRRRTCTRCLVHTDVFSTDNEDHKSFPLPHAGRAEGLPTPLLRSGHARGPGSGRTPTRRRSRRELRSPCSRRPVDRGSRRRTTPSPSTTESSTRREAGGAARPVPPGTRAQRGVLSTLVASRAGTTVRSSCVTGDVATCLERASRRLEPHRRSGRVTRSLERNRNGRGRGRGAPPWHSIQGGVPLREELADDPRRAAGRWTPNASGVLRTTNDSGWGFDCRTTGCSFLRRGCGTVGAARDGHRAVGRGQGGTF